MPRMAPEAAAAAAADSGPKCRCSSASSQAASRRRTRLLERRVQQIRRQGLDARRQRVVGRHQPRHRRPAPADAPVRARRERVVGLLGKGADAVADVAAQRAVGDAAEARRRLPERGVLLVDEALHPPRGQALHEHLAGRGHLDDQLVRAVTRDHGRAAVHELLGQPLVQRVGQPVLDRARALLPVARVGQPRRPVRDVGPGADVGDAREQRVGVALHAVEGGDLRRHPVLGQAAARPPQVPVDLAEQPGVGVGQHVAEVGHLADVPEQPHRLRRASQRRDLGIGGEGGRGRDGRRRRACARSWGTGGRRSRLSRSARGDAKLRSELRQDSASRGSKRWLSTAATRLSSNGPRSAVGPKVPSRRCRPARPAICATSAGRRGRGAVPSNFTSAGEGDVVDVEVEAHPDGVGGHQVVDLARLVQRDLRVPRARRQRAEDQRRAARLAADAVGDLVEVGHREDDDGGAPRQPRDLPRRGVGEGGEARPADDRRLRAPAAQERLDRLRAQEHRLLQPAGVEQAVGEDVAALAVGAELDLVHGQEVDAPVERHRLHRADEVRGRAGNDPLLAGHQRDLRPGPRACTSRS